MRQMEMPPLDPEGNVVDMQQAQQKKYVECQDWLNSKIDEFERSLGFRCQAEDEVYNKLGWDGKMGGYLYQVGMNVHILRADPDGVSTQVVGTMGQ